MKLLDIIKIKAKDTVKHNYLISYDIIGSGDYDSVKDSFFSVLQKYGILNLSEVESTVVLTSFYKKEPLKFILRVEMNRIRKATGATIKLVFK